MKAILKWSRTSDESSVIPINDSFNLVAMESTACFKGGLLICTFGPLIALTNKYSEPFSIKKNKWITILYYLYIKCHTYYLVNRKLINIKSKIISNKNIRKTTHQFLMIYYSQKHVAQIISSHKTLIVC